jgi:phosphatidylserine decarboxylase
MTRRGPWDQGMPIAREGWPFVGVLLGLGALACGFQWLVPGGLLLAAGLFTAYFFRDPEREPPADPRLVVSPADGRIVGVVASPSGSPEGGSTRVSIFLSIFDVHVNRAPIGGRVAKVEYHKGAFLPAFNDKASLQNEQNKVTLDDGKMRLAFTQIAGLIARRIVFTKRVEDSVRMGERVGLIKFGSRVDVFLPQEVRVLVRVGDRVRGGVSVIGERT